MASDMIEGELNVLTMSNDQIVNLISATHLPADENFDAGSVFVLVRNILKRVTHIVDHVLLGREHLEKPEEKVSRASFDPLLCTLLKQVSYEMACKAPGVEIAHKTTMSILDKLSSYSWNAKAVLTLAAFALDYEDIILALAQLHSSHQLVESVEHIPAGMLKYDTVGELNEIIYYTLNIMESIFELKKISTNKDINHDEPAYVYWIIITIVACIPHMYCLTSDEDKTQDPLPLDQTINQTLFHLKSRIRICRSQIEEKKAGRKLKEFLQTPDEILEVFKELIFARNDVQPLIDDSTNEMLCCKDEAQVCRMTPPGPYAIKEYTFLCGGKDNIWIEQFSKKVNVVAKDPVIKEAHISIELSCIGKSYKQQPFWKRTKTPKKTESDLGNQEIQKLLLSFKNESKWAVLTKWSTRVVSDNGTTILKVLEAFEEWKVNVPKKGFEICFKEYYERFLQIGTLP